MNIVNKLTLRHLRMNKRRTLVTIMGVIISVAMITAVTTLAVSFLDLMVRDSIQSKGLWHVQYSSVTEGQVKELEADDQSASVALRGNDVYFPLEQPKSMYRPYMQISQYNDVALKNFHIEAVEGRLPKNSRELAVSQEFFQREAINWGLGDTVELPVGERRSTGVDQILSDNSPLMTTEDGEVGEEVVAKETRAYTIVGIIKTPRFSFSYFPGYFAVTHFDGFGAEGSVNGQPAEGFSAMNAFVEMKTLDGRIFAYGQQLASENHIQEVIFNEQLLRYMGILADDPVRSMLWGLTVILMGIIITGSVSLIYNAFAISVSERSLHLGMLSSVGATARQKRNSVLFEGFVIGLISIPVGILCGVLGIEITFQCINPAMKELLNVETEMNVVISFPAFLAAVLLSVVTIFISLWQPARRASKISPIDAIRQTEDVRLTQKAVKTWGLTARLFGIEGEVALKNLKRNKRRYKATVFSLVISLVLFLTVSYFGNSFSSAYDMTTDGVTFDVYASISRQVMERDKVVKEMMESEYVKQANEVIELELPLEEGEAGFGSVRLVALDDAALQQYAEKAGVSGQQLMDPKGMAVIGVDVITYKDSQTDKYIEKQMLDNKPGDQWQLYSLVYQEGDTAALEPFVQLTMTGFSEELPVGVSTVTMPDSPLFICSKALLEELMGRLDWDYSKIVSSSHYVFFASDQPQKLADKLEQLENPKVSIVSVTEMRRQEQQMMFLVGVFVYGFITLITLICVANIFNTISTSIALRRKEFAMLRSVGMTPEGFNRMIRYESLLYGMKALLYGMPLSIALMYGLYRFYMNSFDFPFELPWASIFTAVLAVFAVVFVTMVYASSKIKKENIIDCLRKEMI